MLKQEKFGKLELKVGIKNSWEHDQACGWEYLHFAKAKESRHSVRWCFAAVQFDCDGLRFLLREMFPSSPWWKENPIIPYFSGWTFATTSYIQLLWRQGRTNAMVTLTKLRAWRCFRSAAVADAARLVRMPATLKLSSLDAARRQVLWQSRTGTSWRCWSAPKLRFS